MLVSNYNTQCQIAKNSSTYGILNRKNLLDIHFFFLSLLFSPVGVFLIRLQQYSANICGIHCTPFQYEKYRD